MPVIGTFRVNGGATLVAHKTSDTGSDDNRY